MINLFYILRILFFNYFLNLLLHFAVVGLLQHWAHPLTAPMQMVCLLADVRLCLCNIHVHLAIAIS